MLTYYCDHSSRCFVVRFLGFLFLCHCFLANWCSVGTKVCVHSHYQQGSYQKDGKTVYTNDFIVDSLEKLSSKKETAEAQEDYGFVNVEADGLNDEGLPFN